MQEAKGTNHENSIHLSVIRAKIHIVQHDGIMTWTQNNKHLLDPYIQNAGI